MNYGLYLSASGVLTNLYRQDVFANNLANAQTVGFKPDFAGVTQRSSESVEKNLGFDLSNKLLDRLGGGVFAGPQFVNFQPAALEKTGGNLDVAIEKRGEFFAVTVEDAANGESAVHLTRDGRFVRSAEGYLVTIAGGHKVLDQADTPIQLGQGSVTINRQGQMRQDGEVIATLQIATVSNLEALVKRGQNLFRINGPDSLRQIVEDPDMRPGFVETSGTDPIKALMKLISATKAATGNATLIRYHDLLMDQAVNVLGRVTA